MEKYEKLRMQIKTGDIVLYRGNGVLARIIQWADHGAYYNHTGIAYWLGERLFTIDAWSNGTQLVPMSRRMNAYEDFCIIRKNRMDMGGLRNALNNLFNFIEKNKPYGGIGLIKRLLYIRCHNIFEWLFKIKALTPEQVNYDKNPVCSDVSRMFGVDDGLTSLKAIILPSPEDLRRYIDKTEATVLFDDAPAPKI